MQACGQFRVARVRAPQKPKDSLRAHRTFRKRAAVARDPAASEEEPRTFGLAIYDTCTGRAAYIIINISIIVSGLSY